MSLAKVSLSQRGLTLVELMVSMAIGLVVIGAVFVNYLSSSVGSRQSAAFMQVTDDASLALGILRNHIAMAGYSEPTGTSASGLTRGMAGMAIFGCDDGFADTSENLGLEPGVIACATTPNGPDSLLVRYESDGLNTPMVKRNNIDLPSDCVGNGLTGAVVPGRGTVFTAYNRFRIDPASAEFECRGNGGATPSSQTLLENIADMQVTYGMSATNAPQRVVRYVTASQIGSSVQTAAQREVSWNSVISVRICLVVRSRNAVLEAITPYRDCAGAVVPPTDRRVYRAFTTTVALNNRIANP